MTLGYRDFENVVLHLFDPSCINVIYLLEGTIVLPCIPWLCWSLHATSFYFSLVSCFFIGYFPCIVNLFRQNLFWGLVLIAFNYFVWVWRVAASVIKKFLGIVELIFLVEISSDLFIYPLLVPTFVDVLITLGVCFLSSTAESRTCRNAFPLPCIF